MYSKSNDVIVVGNVGIDTNIYLNGSDIDFNVEANFTENIDYVGQAGGFSARGFAQLGKQAAFIGYIGDDFNGKLIHEEFKKDKIDTTGLFLDKKGTSRSVNFMYQDGRRKNFYDGKSHMTLEPDLEICRTILSSAKLVHFNIPNWARKLLPISKELGLTISCDIQDIVTIEDCYRDDFINAADILFFSSANYPDPTNLIHLFMKRNPLQIIIVGMVKDGCALGMNNQICFFKPIKLPEPIVDTNGAGDGLAVGFLSSYILEKYSIEKSIRRGQITARYTCTQKATTSSLITHQQLNHYDQFISK